MNFIKAPKDFWAGLMFIALGAGFVIAAQGYDMGTAVRMGPAYFPTVLGGLLVLLGLGIFIPSVVIKGPPIEGFALKTMIVLLIAVFAFGALIRTAGLVPATILLVFISASRHHDFRPLQIALLAIGMAAFSALVFQWGLGLPLKLWPEF